jgi:hypothetical protein
MGAACALDIAARVESNVNLIKGFIIIFPYVIVSD